MLKNYHIHSYGSVYDELPNRWIEILGVIENEVFNAVEKKRELNGH